MGAEEDVTPGLVGQPVNSDPTGLASGTPVAPPPPNDPMLDLALAGGPAPALAPPQSAHPDSYEGLLLPGGAPAAPPPAADGYKETVLDPLLSGTPAPGQAGPPSGGPLPILVDIGPAGTRFRVDPDEAQKVATTLRDAGTEAFDLAEEARQLSQQVRAAAADGVSQFAAERMREWWAGPDGSFAPTIEQFAQRCDEAAVGYDQQLAAYLRADEQAATAMGRGTNPSEPT